MMTKLETFIENRGIHKVAKWPAGYWSVELDDGSFGTGRSIAAALEKAQGPDAQNLRKVAA
jgi:hypothetical protein